MDSWRTSELKQAEQADGKELGVEEVGAALGALCDASQQLLQLGALRCRLEVRGRAELLGQALQPLCILQAKPPGSRGG